MAHYLMKYKGIYRVLPELDKDTHDFPRDSKGNIANGYDDIYIVCQNQNKIYHYGGRTLVAFIPSLGRGHNIIKKIFNEYQNGDLELYSTLIGQDENGENIYNINYERLYKDKSLNNIIYDIMENDSEIEFKFKSKDIDIIAPLLKPKTSGANISPFSSKNLPKSKVEMPSAEIQRYKAILSKVSKDDLLLIHKITTNFLDNILQKKCKKSDKNFNGYKSDMKKLCMARQAKEYIYTKQMWEEYLAYLQKEIESYYN